MKPDFWIFLLFSYEHYYARQQAQNINKKVNYVTFFMIVMKKGKIISPFVF